MRRLLPLLLLLLSIGFTACQQGSAEDLVIYSGRSESLVEPAIERFEEETDIDVSVRYGETAQLAVALSEEGEQTNADLFWAQDAGALGAVEADGRFMELPDSILAQVPERYANDTGTWVATSGRARTLAYAPDRVDTENLPERLFDLTDPEYEGRVGWAPSNGSFQAHVTALRKLVGDDSTRAWLEAMQENGAEAYSNNTSIIQAIADGEVDLGLPNHYYLFRFKSEDPDFPVEQQFFAPGDPGNLVNVAGVGVLEGTDQEEAALRFVSFLLSEDSQQYFADEVFEYPVVDGVTPSTELTSMDRLGELQPQIDLDELRDLEATLDMLREVGLL